MNIVIEILTTIFYPFTLVPSLLGAMFSAYDSISGFQDMFIAAVLGIPVCIVSVYGVVILIIKFIGRLLQ